MIAYNGFLFVPVADYEHICNGVYAGERKSSNLAVLALSSIVSVKRYDGNRHYVDKNDYSEIIMNHGNNYIAQHSVKEIAEVLMNVKVDE